MPDRRPGSQIIRDEAALRSFAEAIIQPGALPEVTRRDPLLAAGPAVDFARRMLVVALCELSVCTGLTIEGVEVKKGEIVVRYDRRWRPNGQEIDEKAGHFAYQAVEVPRHAGPVRFEVTNR